MKIVYYICGVVVAVTAMVVLWMMVASPRATREWKAAVSQNTIPAYAAFLKDYAQSQYGPLASNKLAILLETRAWSELKENPSVARLHSFQREFANSTRIPESLVMLTNTFRTEWEKTKTGFDEKRYTDFIALKPPPELEAEARFMLRVLDKAKDDRVAKLHSIALKPTDISFTATIFSFHCKGPLNLGPFSLPDGVPMRIDCAQDMMLKNEPSLNGAIAIILYWGLGAPPESSQMQTEGVFLGNDLQPNAVTVSGANKSIILALKTEDGSLLTVNPTRQSDEFFTPVAILISKVSN